MKRTSRVSLPAIITAIILTISGCSNIEQSNISLTQNENNINTNSENGQSSPSDTDDFNQSQTGSEAGDGTVSAATPVQTSEANPPQIENEQVINGNMVYLLNDHWYGIQLYAGGYNQDLYIKSVDAFAKDLDGIANVYSMIAPTDADFYCPPGYEEYNASQIDDINYIEQSLGDNITSIHCYDVIKEHIDEYIYFRTDHHWTALGAYYAAEQFAKAAGVPFKELNDANFEEYVIEGFIGSLYGSTGDANLLNDPDYLVYYAPKNDYQCYYYDTYYNLDGKFPFFIPQEPKNAFGTFMGSDKKIVRVETDVNNGRKLMVIKDSYGNVEIPFYMNSFEEIYVTDVRFFDLNAIDFIKQQGITDVLFTMCTYSAAGQNCEGIEMMRTGAGRLID